MRRQNYYNYKNKINSKIKKDLTSEKDMDLELHQNALHSSDQPLSPYGPLDPGKNSIFCFFIFCPFSTF